MVFFYAQLCYDSRSRLSARGPGLPDAEAEKAATPGCHAVRMVKMEKQPQKSYLMTFYTTTHTMQTFADLKSRMDVAIMPVPREISASCGLAIKFRGEDWADFRAYFDQLEVPARLFCMEQSRDGNGRSAALIAERERRQASAQI